MGGFFHPGMTKYHTTGLIVPLLASVSPYIWQKFIPSSGHQVMKALAYGSLTTVATYFLMGLQPLQEEKYRLNKAVLLGLLTAELVVFAIPEKIPSITLIVFFLFMYLFGLGVDAAHDSLHSSH
jgi:hypothetical protein